MFSWFINLFKPKKLCKHEWEFVNKELKEYYDGFCLDSYYLNTYQCKLCLKVEKEMRFSK